MPNRVLRDWTDSESIDSLDVHAERFFTRLIMKVDDYGRFSSNPKLLRSALFPLKTEIRETDISRWLTACKAAGRIALYVIGQKGYLEINDFRQTKRQKYENYPPQPDAKQMLSNCYADAHPEREIESENEIEKEIEIESENTHAPNFQKSIIEEIQSDVRELKKKKEKSSAKKEKSELHGFDKSEYFDKEIFRQKLQESDPPYCNADPDYYYDSLLHGWKSKGYKYLDWFAAVQNWIRSDIRDSKFKGKFSQPHSINDAKQSTSKSGFPTKGEQVTAKNLSQFERMVIRNQKPGTEEGLNTGTGT